VTAAYCVVFALVLLYVLIIALKLQRLEREVDELAGRAVAEEQETGTGTSREPAPVG
jgi:CcmD family protein